MPSRCLTPFYPDTSLPDVSLHIAKLLPGWPKFDGILLNGSIEEIPASVLGQLREGARLVAILASGANSARPGKAFLFVKIDGEASGLPHFDAGARALPGFSRAPAFAF